MIYNGLLEPPHDGSRAESAPAEAAASKCLLRDKIVIGDTVSSYETYHPHPIPIPPESESERSTSTNVLSGDSAIPPPSHTRKPTRANEHHTPLSQILNARNAYLFAEQGLKQPLNTFITINFNGNRRHWKTGDRSPNQVSYLRDKTLRALRNWCRHQGIAPLWIYVLENSHKGGKGPHIHLLMHLPEGRYSDLIQALNNFLMKTMGWNSLDIEEVRTSRSGSGAKTWLPFDISPAKKGSDFPLTPKEALTRLRYISKGMDPDQIVEIDGKRQTFEQHAGMGDSPHITIQESGDPRTKRPLSATDSLSISARAAQGWIETDDLDWISREVERKKLQKSVLDLLAKPKAPPIIQEENIPEPPKAELAAKLVPIARGSDDSGGRYDALLRAMKETLEESRAETRQFNEEWWRLWHGDDDRSRIIESADAGKIDAAGGP